MRIRLVCILQEYNYHRGVLLMRFHYLLGLVRMPSLLVHGVWRESLDA